MTGLIGSRCKCSNALSRGILISRLIFPQFCFQRLQDFCKTDLTINKRHHYSGASNGRVPPDPIPNSEVKPSSTDDTWAASSPGKVGQRQNYGVFCYFKSILNKKREPVGALGKVEDRVIYGSRQPLV